MRAILAVLVFLFGAQAAFAGACPAGNVLFTGAPFDMNGPSAPSGIIPLGRMTPEGSHMIPTRHLYVDQGFTAGGNTPLKIYAPGDLELVAVTLRQTDEGPDWSFYLKPCSQVILYYFHIDKPADELLNSIGDMALNSLSFKDDNGKVTETTKLVSIKVSQGHLIGQASLSAVHWGLEDFRQKPLPFANPKRYAVDFAKVRAALEIPAAQNALADELLPHVVPQALYNRCPIDYFSDDLRGKLTAMLADGLTKAVNRRPCHTHMLDIAGKAQGNWWPDTDPTHDALFNETTAIALATWNVRPNTQVFSLNAFNTELTADLIGSSAEIKDVRTVFTFPIGTGMHNRRFFEVTTSTTPYCYDGLTLLGTNQKLNGAILIQLPLVRFGALPKLYFEIVPGKTCTTDIKFSDEKKKTFYR